MLFLDQNALGWGPLEIPAGDQGLGSLDVFAWVTRRILTSRGFFVTETIGRLNSTAGNSRQMRTPQLSKLIVAGDNPTSPVHVARTAVAAIASYLVARLFHLPEAYWATVSTIVVMQSTLGAALPVSARRFAGTAAGAAVAAAVGTYLGQGVWMFGIGILVIGALGAAFRVERSAYRYANITLAIVLLVPRSNSVWRVAVHRFFEVSIGIAMGLLLSAVWPERQPGKVDIQKA